MNLVIDYGNSRTKAASFLDNRMVEQYSFNKAEDINRIIEHSYENVLISSVSRPLEDILKQVRAKKKFVLSIDLPLPVKILYETPGTLGVDRIAAVCGAQHLFPNKNCLVIDAGTCITYEFLDAEGNYQGGAISPGIGMRFEAMHIFTARLPIITPLIAAPLIGKSTETCMQSGVMNGVLGEVNEIISRYLEQYPDLDVIICGGDYSFFENRTKHPIFASPELVLMGLNRILSYNVEQ